MGITGVFTDDFGTDANEWVSWIDRSKVGVHSGHFVLEAPGQYSFNTAVCNKCPRLEKPYYLQAAFGIDGATNANYGLIIKAESGLPTDRFYLFMVSPEARRYSLWFHTENAWYARLSGASDRIRSSPATNVLGIYVNGGNVELYIGGAIVDAFEDSGTSLLTGKPGFYAEADSGVKVLIDDFLFENMGGE
jgi:hypothetical protein